MFQEAIGKILKTRKSALLVTGGASCQGRKKCWRLKSKRLVEISEIPQELSGEHISVCPFEGVGVIVTGGVGYSDAWHCAVYHAAAKVLHSFAAGKLSP